MKKRTLSFLGFFILIAGLFGILFLLNQKQDLRKRAADEKVILNLLPPSQTSLKPGDYVNFNLTASQSTPNFYKVTAAEIKVNYPNDKLTLVSVTPGTYFKPADFNLTSMEMLSLGTSCNIKNDCGTTADGINCSTQKWCTSPALADQTPGQARFYLGVPCRLDGTSCLPQINDGIVATVKFQAKDSLGAVPVSLDTASQIAALKAGDNTAIETSVAQVNTNPVVLTIANDPASTPTPAPQSGTLNFKIKFQGINDQKPPTTIKVTLVKGTNTAAFNAPVTADTNGIYSGQLTNLTPDTYTIYIKGFAHLQKKVEDNVVISANTTATKDWSGFELLAGDLNNSNSITIQDFGLISQNYRTNSSVADLNLDDNVTIQDFGLLSQNYRGIGDQW